MVSGTFQRPRETTTVKPVFTLPTLPLLEPVPLPHVTLPPVPANLTIPVPVLPAPQIGNASSIYISATQFDAPGDDRQNLNGEWVQLTNKGDDTVLIAGWTLSDKGQSTLYTFPAIFLVPGESVTIFSGTGTLNNTALFMGKTDPVWGNSGDIAILKDGRERLSTRDLKVGIHEGDHRPDRRNRCGIDLTRR